VVDVLQKKSTVLRSLRSGLKLAPAAERISECQLSIVDPCGRPALRIVESADWMGRAANMQCKRIHLRKSVGSHGTSGRPVGGLVAVNKIGGNEGGVPRVGVDKERVEKE